jgi:hypothetical protein
VFTSPERITQQPAYQHRVLAFLTRARRSPLIVGARVPSVEKQLLTNAPAMPGTPFA